jgi:hypothetical protein
VVNAQLPGEGRERGLGKRTRVHKNGRPRQDRNTCEAHSIVGRGRALTSNRTPSSGEGPEVGGGGGLV